MSAFDKAFNDIQSLVSTFNRSYGHYMSAGYSEAEARQDFIDKFFTALGWDVRHKHQTNPYEQEVKIEKSQKQQNESARKRADYAFFIGPNYKDEVFFAEAKKPSVLIGNNPQHYFQTIKYGWNSGCPICALTDFEEFAIIDCRQKPDIKYALNGKHKVFKYTDYTDKEKFAEIYWLFSREAVAANSIQKYAATLPKPKGKSTLSSGRRGAGGEVQAIDDSFLEYIDGIRENIAKAFKKANENLNSEELTEATQRTVDRLVFIRFLEDKFIEPEEHVSEWKSWKHFITDCRRLDAKYNGVVFKEHFIDKPHFIGADEKLFLDICSDISGLNSPYDFNYIPIHILGSIYERFLGKIVVATNKRVHIEEKPEVRKAGGVYYTPKYIVDYIVKNTVGKIIEGLTPAQIAGKQSRIKDAAKASPLRGGLEGVSPLAFADIACGSGSFLIGVYDYLLDYHKQYYTGKLAGKTTLDARSEDFGNVDYKDGQWVLSLKLKQDILINNIYGVDIDRQAVEVTQLSLFLKMLEDESLSSTTVKQGAMFSKVLPDLSKNIICGNSLIGWDIMQGQLFENDELKKLNPMDYETAFPLVMKNGGFDAVVGNPPWGADFDNYSLEYLRNSNKEIIVRMIDSFMYFVYKSFFLLNPNGQFGMILPDVLLYQIDNSKLRKFIIGKTSIKAIINMGDVFYKVVRPSAILIYKKEKPKGNNVKVIDVSEKKESKEVIINDESSFIKINQTQYLEIPNNLFITKKPLQYSLLNRLLKRHTCTLKSFVDEDGIQRGVSPDYKEAFLVNSSQIKNYKLEKEKLRATLTGGKQVKKYHIEYPDLNVIYTNRNDDYSKFPNICSYINLFKEKITCKEVKEKKHSIYSLHRSRDENIFLKKEKIIGVITEDEIVASLDLQNTYPTDGIYLFSSNKLNLRFLLGILNSRLFVFIYRLLSLEGGRVLAQVKPTVLNSLPIVNEYTTKQHDQLVTLVTQILEAKKQLAAAVTESDKNFLQNKCNSLDRQIDKLVYELYGLTEEEIKIVEENG